MASTVRSSKTDRSAGDALGVNYFARSWVHSARATAAMIGRRSPRQRRIDAFPLAL